MSLRLEDIQAFLNVVELGSISAAAERMSLSKSVISKRVSDLERHLGVRLLYRSTRNVEPTEAGGFASATATTPRRSYGASSRGWPASRRG